LPVTHTLRGEGFDASEDGTGRGTPLVPVAFAIQAGALRTNPNSGPDGIGVQADHAYTLEARAEVQAVAVVAIQDVRGTDRHGVAVGADCYNGSLTGDVACTMGSPGSSVNASGPTVMVFQPGNLAKGGGSSPSSDIVGTLTSNHGRGATDQFPHVAIPLAFPANLSGTQDPCVSADTAFALGRNNGGENVIAFDTTQITSAANYSNPRPGDPCHPLADGAHVPAVAVSLRGREGGATAELGDEVQNCLRASGGGGDKAHVLTSMSVRRLTPRECERLQGFPDDYTNIPWTEYKRLQRRAAKAGTSYEAELRKRGKGLRGKPVSDCPDGPRYKALGNSWAVPCVAWIGRRINNTLRIAA
jgi:hypothetical protein